MQIVAVDTNKYSLSELVRCLTLAHPDSDVFAFTDPMSAVKFGFNHRIDMVFTEIPMRGVDGLTLARLIREHNEQLKIYFVTETLDYRNEALLMRVDGYLQKPITVEKIKRWRGGWNEIN